MAPMTLGLITALAEEMTSLPAALESSQGESSGGRERVVTGELWGAPAAFTVSGVGLASAARSAALLIELRDS